MELHFSHIGWEIGLPLILMVIDVITGYYNAWKNHEVKSAKMRDGLGKKIAEICYITVGFLFGIAFNLKAVHLFISLYIVYMEIVSVYENCKKLGVELPQEVTEKIKEKEEK